MTRTTRSITASSFRRRFRWSALRPRSFRPGLAILLALSGLATAAEAADYFGRGAADGPNFALPLPGWLQAVVGQAIQLQEAFHRALIERMEAVGGHLSLLPLMAVLGIAFAYGIFHAVGPGHGKMVVASYFLARRSRPWRGVAMGFAIGLVQAVSAILIVIVPAALLHIANRDILAGSDVLEVASYGFILCLGLYMTWGVVTGRGCGHDHDEPLAFRSHRGHGHGHAHADSSCHHQAGARPPKRRGRFLPSGVIGTALGVGIRPCSGAILILLFTLANGLLPLGVLATLVMGAGVAFTISVLGIGIIGLRGSVTMLTGRQAAFARYAQTGLQLAGSLLVSATGAVMLLAVLERGAGPPGLT